MRDFYIIDIETTKPIKVVQTDRYIDLGVARGIRDLCIMDELFLDPIVAPIKRPITYRPQRKGKRGKLSKW